MESGCAETCENAHYKAEELVEGGWRQIDSEGSACRSHVTLAASHEEDAPRSLRITSHQSLIKSESDHALNQISAA